LLTQKMPVLRQSLTACAIIPGGYIGRHIGNVFLKRYIGGVFSQALLSRALLFYHTEAPLQN
jgi:hypothetical protein